MPRTHPLRPRGTDGSAASRGRGAVLRRHDRWSVGARPGGGAPARGDQRPGGGPRRCREVRGSLGAPDAPEGGGAPGPGYHAVRGLALVLRDAEREELEAQGADGGGGGRGGGGKSGGLHDRGDADALGFGRARDG